MSATFGFVIVYSPPVLAQEKQPEVLQKFLTDDVIGVVYFDLEKLNLDETMEIAAQLGFQDSSQVKDFKAIAPEISKEVKSLTDSGISKGYVLLRSSDLQNLGTSLVLPVSGENTSGAAGKLVDSYKRLCKGLGVDPTNQTQNPFNSFDQQSDVVLVAKNAELLVRLQKERPGKVREFNEAWAALGSGALGMILFGDEDSRQVVGQLMPELPAPFHAINGEMVSEEITWAGVELKLGKRPNLKIEIGSSSEKAAKIIEQTLVDSVSFAQKIPLISRLVPADETDFVTDSLQPVRDGNRVSISTEKLSADMARFAKVLSPQVKLARKQASKATKRNSLRQLVLGIHNYESAFRHFPTQAIVDKDGNPLLSWRVQILPFIEENALYSQFKLDEAWDSEHNIKLLEKMPKIYWENSPGAHEQNKAGRTVFQVPAGDGMIFDVAKEFTFGDLTDGSSNTIMVASVAQEHAVPWTKPTDWQVDIKNPLEKLTEKDRTRVEVGIADGSYHELSLEASIENWKRIIQPADGGVVDGDAF